MCLLWSLLLARWLGLESHHWFPRSCNCSENLTLQYHCWILQLPHHCCWSFQHWSPHHLGIPHSQGLFLQSQPHLLHWSHCHLRRWTCCLHHLHHLILLVILVQLSGSWHWMLSWSRTLQCWSCRMESWSGSWSVRSQENEELTGETTLLGLGSLEPALP